MAKHDTKEGMKMDKSKDKTMIKKAFKQHDAQEHKGGKGTSLALKKGGMPMTMKDGKKVPTFAAKKGGMAKMAMGGGVHRMPDGSMMEDRMMGSGMKQGGMTKMAKGGGIEIQGKTKGKMVKMAKGGKAC